MVLIIVLLCYVYKYTPSMLKYPTLMQAFKLLNEKGIYLVDSTAPMLHVEKNNISEKDFFSQTKKLLAELAPLVRNEVVPHLESFEGRWHPSGFMVYPLGTHPVLGTLRFHIWPKGLRRRVLKGRGDMGYVYDGDIHNHAWNLTSLALEYYQDIIFEVNDTPEQGLSDKQVNKNDQWFRVFNVHYSQDVRQSLRTDGRSVYVEMKEQRYAQKGEMHTIKVGVYHAPNIPENLLGATLVFDSFRLASGPDVLIGGNQDPIFDRRLPVSHDDALIAKRHFSFLD